MKRTLAVVFSAGALLVTSSAVAQSVKMKDGKYEITMPDGETMTIGKDGKVKQAPTSFRPKPEPDGNGELKLGATAEKEPRTKGEAVACIATGDLLVENKNIEGEAIAVAMIGSCDAEVFNTNIDATNHGIELAGSGDLIVTESIVQAKKVAINASGSGDVIIERAQIAGPIAINITGTGDVRIKDSRVFGTIVTTGTGKFIDEGGNEFVKDHTKAAFDTSDPSTSKKKAKSKSKAKAK